MAFNIISELVHSIVQLGLDPIVLLNHNFQLFLGCNELSSVQLDILQLLLGELFSLALLGFPMLDVLFPQLDLEVEHGASCP